MLFSGIISCPDLFLIDVMFSNQQKLVSVRFNKYTSSRNKNNGQCTHGFFFFSLFSLQSDRGTVSFYYESTEQAR